MKEEYSNYFTTSDDKQIHYTTNFRVDKNETYKNTLIFNYGLVCSNHHWKEQIPYFEEQGFNILIHNYRGHFESSGKESLKTITFSRMAHDLGELCQALNLQESFALGHSMGVNVTLEFARLYPDLLRGLVVISGTVQPVNNVMFDNNMMSFAIPVLEKLNAKYPRIIKKVWDFSGVNPIVRKLIHQQGFNAKNVPLEFVEIYLNKVAELGPDLFLQLFSEMSKHDVISALPSLKTKSLIIGGDSDLVVPSHQTRILHEKIPNSEIYMLKNGSHVPQADFPELINERILHFIKNTTL